jgi:MoaA/NifB/PqqE/SkfB family radical SAM enzyme
VRRIRQRIGLEKVTLCGGDPLTRPDIVLLLTGLRETGVAISLDTVGTAFLRDAAIRFFGNGVVRRVDCRVVSALTDLIGIPIDGSTDSIQLQFRRFSSVVEQNAILSLLDDVEARVCINTVAHRQNLGDLPNIASLIQRHPSVIQWQIFQFMPIGPLGSRNRRRFEIANDDFRSAVESIPSLPGIRLTPKSRASRPILLLDTDGSLWRRRTDDERGHSDGLDEERLVLGHVDDPNLVDRIAQLAIA